MLRVTPEYVQFISKEVLAPLNWILCPQYFSAFPKLTPRRDVENGERKHHRHRGVRKCLPPERKQDVKPELMDHDSSTPYYQPVYVKCRCPNWLNSLRHRGKQVRELLQTNSKILFYAYRQHWFSALSSTFGFGYFHSDKIRFHFFNWDFFLNRHSRDQHKAVQRSTFVFCRERFYPA